MSCVDCHNPHGSFLPKNIQTVAANEPGCFKCHGDKRGPFPYEHAAMRLEGCTGCHQPHGSDTRALLRGGDLAGRRVAVSAGGTREAIDPVRFVGNHSSGKMGYALALAARRLLARSLGIPLPAPDAMIEQERDDILKIFGLHFDAR